MKKIKIGEEVTVRKAKVKDLDVVRAMYIEFMDYHAKLDSFLEVVKNSKTFATKYLRKYVYASKKVLFVAEKDGEIIGFIDALVMKTPAIYKNRDVGAIPDAFVTRGMRSRGVSAVLLEACFEWFKSKKIKRIELSMCANNKLAIKAWNDNGFKDVFIRKRKII